MSDQKLSHVSLEARIPSASAFCSLQSPRFSPSKTIAQTYIHLHICHVRIYIYICIYIYIDIYIYIC